MFEEKKEPVIGVWQEVCSYVRDQLSPMVCSMWFDKTIPLELGDQHILLGVSDEFFGSVFLDNYGETLQDILFKITGKKLEIRFEYGHLPVDADSENSGESKEEKMIQAELTPHPVAAPNCQERNTFDNFVVGEENNYAYSAATAVAKQPGSVYNPLYIYGGPGMGKTHLIQAVANDVIKRNPKAVVRYISCENFLNEYLDSLRNKTHNEFRDTFRKVDMLLIDDVHHLSGKTALQEEFFNTFNTLHNAGKQIILTSDKQPSDIPGLEERLVSRFKMGVSTQITPPSFEMRLAILRQERAVHKLSVDDNILSFIAEKIKSNIRPLKGAMLRLLIYSTAMKTDITTETLQSLLEDLLEKTEETANVTISMIQKAVADHFGLHVHDLTGTKRTKEVASARMIAMYLCRKLTPCAQQLIGQEFGGRNHSTVIHACKEVEKICLKDENLKHTLTLLQKKILNQN